MNSKTIIIYKSETGFTQRYAQWIGEALKGNTVDWKERKKINFAEYDTVIYGGSFHAGFITGLKWFKSRLPELTGKKVVVFATGATPPQAPEVQTAMEQNFADIKAADVKTFYFHGGLCYEKMGTGSKLMMAMFRTVLKKAEGENSEAYKMVQHSYDFSSKEFIKPLVEYCRGQENE